MVSRSRRASVTSVTTSPSLPVAARSSTVSSMLSRGGEPTVCAERASGNSRRKAHGPERLRCVPVGTRMSTGTGGAGQTMKVTGRFGSEASTVAAGEDAAPRERLPGRLARRGVEDPGTDPRPGGRADESRDDVTAESQADCLFSGDDASLVQGEPDEDVGYCLA